MNDEELQDAVEKGMIDDSLDSVAYQKVFNALRQEPSYQLNYRFADKVMAVIGEKEIKKERTFERWVVAAGVILFIIAFAVATALSHFKLSAGAFRFVSNYLPLILFGVAFVMILQWADKKLLHKGARQ